MMIRCNLANILTAKGLKITSVSKATGISRTTLTALASNYSQGIQFDTLETLCRFLQVRPNDLISFLPFCISLKKVAFSKALDSVVTGDSAELYGTFVYETWGRQQEFVLPISVSWVENENNVTSILYIDLTLPEIIEQIDENGRMNYINEEAYNECNKFSSEFQKMGVGFLSDLEKTIEIAVKSQLEFLAGCGSDCLVILNWPKEFIPDALK